MSPLWSLLLWAVLIWGAAAAPVSGQGRLLILRDLSRVETESLRFNEQGVILKDGTRYDWDQVLTAELEEDRYRQFQEFTNQIGLPLYRLRRRLAAGDWPALAEIAEPIYAHRLKRVAADSSPRVQYLVALATFYGRWYRGDRAESVYPFIEACRIRRAADGPLADLPATIDLSPSEIQTEFTERLLPIWFTEWEARAVADSLRSLSGPATESPGLAIYRAAAAVLCETPARTRQLFAEMETSSETTIVQWLPILKTQLEIRQQITGPSTAELRWTSRTWVGFRRAAANYLLAHQMSKIEDDYDAAVLEWLRIPATGDDRLRHLSAAALFHAASLAERAGRADESAVMRAELLKEFPLSYHAKQVSHP